jgi:hypothetical protein
MILATVADKRRSLWIAAQDSPDGEQIEEADLMQHRVDPSGV